MIADFLFFAFAGAAVLGGLMVVSRRNPVASVMYLIVVFFSLSGMFLLLEAHFIAALQIILYAGAIMVLFLFVVMLLNLGHATWSDIRGPLGRFLAGAVGLGLMATVTRVLLGADEPLTGVAAGPSAIAPLLAAKGAVAAVAEPLFERYMVAFEVTGLLLLVSMIGAIVLARRQAP